MITTYTGIKTSWIATEKDAKLTLSFQRGCFTHLRPERTSLGDDDRAEVTCTSERHLQLICLFMLSIIKKNVSVCLCVCNVAMQGLSVSSRFHEMI